MYTHIYIYIVYIYITFSSWKELETPTEVLAQLECWVNLLKVAHGCIYVCVHVSLYQYTYVYLTTKRKCRMHFLDENVEQANFINKVKIGMVINNFCTLGWYLKNHQHHHFFIICTIYYTYILLYTCVHIKNFTEIQEN